MAWTLSADQCQYVLENSARDITNLTDISYLFPILYSKGLITESKFKSLEEIPAHERLQLFHNILANSERKPSAFQLFIEALQEEKHHVGHKLLASKLLEEVSKIKSGEVTSSESELKKQVPANLLHERQHYDTRSQPGSPRMPSKPRVPSRSRSSQRSKSESQCEMHSERRNDAAFDTRNLQETEKMSKAILEPEDDHSQHFDNVYLSSQIKKMNAILDADSTSQQNTMEQVNMLSGVVAHMGEKMNDMQQLLQLAISNQEANEDGNKDYYNVENPAISKVPISTTQKVPEVTSGIHQTHYQTFQPAESQYEHQEREKQFDANKAQVTKNRTIHSSVSVPNSTPQPHISANNPLHALPIDGPCEINCCGEIGGICYLHSHGLKLYFPPGCSQQNVKIIIHVYLSDKSSINNNGLRVASAVFKFQSNVKTFNKAVTLRIPHYIKIDSDQDKQNMCFIIQRGSSEPDIRKDGHFPIKKSYGSLKITQFCSIYAAHAGSKLHPDNDQGEANGIRSYQGQLMHQQNNNSCKSLDQKAPSLNGVSQQSSSHVQFQSRQEQLEYFSRDKIKYEALLALPLNRNHLTTSWRGAFYIFRGVVSWKHSIIDSIREDDRINFPLEIFSKEVNFTSLKGGDDNRGVVTLKAVNDPNAYWFVDPHPNKVEIQTVEDQLEEVAHYSKEYTDYHFLIQHRNPPRSTIYVNKRRLHGSCTELNCRLEVDGIKDIQQIDLIKTDKRDFEHEVINEKTNQPSSVTVEQPPTYYTKEPTMKLLHKYVIKHVAYKWDEIAYALEFLTPQKNLIDTTEKGVPIKCCTLLFEEWLETDAGIIPKTWGTLLEELGDSGNFKKSLEQIKKDLQEYYEKP